MLKCVCTGVDFPSPLFALEVSLPYYFLPLLLSLPLTLPSVLFVNGIELLQHLKKQNYTL